MSVNDIAEFFVHTATVETLAGTTGYGVDLFAAPITLDPATGNGCFIDDTRRMVRSSDGEQVISETTLYTYPANAPYFVPNSRVTIRGVISRVITVNLNDSGPLDLPDHVAVTLT